LINMPLRIFSLYHVGMCVIDGSLPARLGEQLKSHGESEKLLLAFSLADGGLIRISDWAILKRFAYQKRLMRKP
jgi:hypothetical protein